MMADNIRLWLQGQLAPLLPTFELVPWDQSITPSKPTAMFYRSQVIPTPEAPDGYYTHTISLWVLTASQVGPRSLDQIDAALDDVLTALYQVRNIWWDDAQYRILNDTHPAFVVTVQVPSNIRAEV